MSVFLVAKPVTMLPRYYPTEWQRKAVDAVVWGGTFTGVVWDEDGRREDERRRRRRRGEEWKRRR